MGTELIKCNAVAISEQWYIELCEDCRDIVTETEFTSRWALVEGYHLLGKRILQESDKLNKLSNSGIDYKAQIATDINRSSRTVYYAVQFAREYPDLNLLPEGKDCSWHKVVNKYLTDGTEKKVVKKVDLYRMISQIKELLEHEYATANQEVVSSRLLDTQGREGIIKCEFIRYLQDQVNKITGG